MTDGHLPANSRSIAAELGKAVGPNKGKNALLSSKRPISTVRLLYHHREFIDGVVAQSRRRTSLTSSSAIDPLETFWLVIPRERQIVPVSKPLEGSGRTGPSFSFSV